MIDGAVEIVNADLLLTQLQENGECSVPSRATLAQLLELVGTLGIDPATVAVTSGFGVLGLRVVDASN